MLKLRLLGYAKEIVLLKNNPCPYSRGCVNHKGRGLASIRGACTSAPGLFMCLLASQDAAGATCTQAGTNDCDVSKLAKVVFPSGSKRRETCLSSVDSLHDL